MTKLLRISFDEKELKDYYKKNAGTQTDDINSIIESECHWLNDSGIKLDEIIELTKTGFRLYIPRNEIIKENGYFTSNGIVKMLRNYKKYPEKIQFIADMLEE